ncbi:MAG: ABC transporter permease [Lachnospiraceae bacterium]|nr:ABC transporter permease [Lachnospiraceae bacterium]
MFFRLYRYSLLRISRRKLNIFWSLLFPIILGTLFQLSFGGFLDQEVSFHQIPVAYVEGEGADAAFQAVLEELEKGSQMIKLQPAGEEEAKKLLQDGTVEGIYSNGGGTPKLRLTVSGQGINESILSTVIGQYRCISHVFTQIGQERPQKIQAAAEDIKKERQYIKEWDISGKPILNTMDYFYSLLAMNCLMAATAGLMCAVEFKADLSSLAARRVVSSAGRFLVLLADLAAVVTMQFLYLVFSAGYLLFALEVPIGNQWGLMLLALFGGCVLGVTLGFFIGVAGKLSENAKEGLCVGIMMVSSFFSGLMVAEMRWLVEEYAPWFARINPASLIVRAFYSLNVYDTYGQYAQCLGSLMALSLLLGAGSFVIIRRERYASI